MTNEDLPFQSVHDSYWTTASNVARMNYLLRKAFVEMYQHEYPEQMVDLMEFYFDLNKPFGSKIDMTDPALSIKGSSDPRRFIFEINAGNSRIRHRTTLNLNDVNFNQF